jgi:hypothetical protein
MMRAGIAADHGGFTLKAQVAVSLRGTGYAEDHEYFGELANI